MNKKFILTAQTLIMFFTAIAFANAQINSKTNRGDSFEASGDEQRIFDLVNREREKNNLPALFQDENLARLARNYSEKMAQENFFSHYDNLGLSVQDRARAMRIKGWSKIGENLFTCDGYKIFDRLAVKGWMNSPEHRRNILDADFNLSGIGIARAPDGRVYITQVFIRK